MTSSRFGRMVAGALAIAGALLTSAIALHGVTSLTALQSAADGWQIAADASTLENPVALTPAIMSKGQDLFKSKCQRCHGATGKGDGPDGESERPPADLTDTRRSGRNPDGVIFYKIWNGRANPKMPAFKSDISRDDIWAIVHYVKTLRMP